MLMRTSALLLHGCRPLHTPCFIPSFSSRGFERSRNGYSETKELYRFAAPHLDSISLISAFDLHYGFVAIEDIVANHSDIVVIDSGGYEAAEQIETRWNFELLLNTLSSWPDQIPSVMVSYDSATTSEPVQSQIERALQLQSNFPTRAITCLLRAEDNDRCLKIESLGQNLKALNSFSIVGVTERDLGNSLFERAQAIGEIRTLMDNAGVVAPIHVFGSLSPLSSTIYFLMGAELFDGLSWLRYRFSGGRLLHISDDLETEQDALTSGSALRMDRVLSNLSALDKLSELLQQFCVSKNWSSLPNGELCKKIFELLNRRA